MVFVEELYCNSILIEGEEFLTEAVVAFFLPFAGEKGYNFIGAYVSVSTDGMVAGKMMIKHL